MTAPDPRDLLCVAVTSLVTVRLQGRTTAHIAPSRGDAVCGAGREGDLYPLLQPATWSDRPCKRCARIIERRFWPDLFAQLHRDATWEGAAT